MVLRRLSGRTDNTAPVLTLITQFGGGKTHTLTTLYHLAMNGEAVAGHNGVADLVREAGIPSVPQAKVAVFVGNAGGPQPGRETPWIDVARQLAGDAGVAALGSAAKTTPPIHRRVGTAILFESSGGPTDKMAHLPELRFALGEPELDTTSIDNAAFALEDRSYFVRKACSDGFRIGQPTMKKVVSDRRASLDEESEVKSGG